MLRGAMLPVVAAVAMAAAMPAAAAAQGAVSYDGIATLIESFISPDSATGWPALDAHRDIRWSAPGVTLLETDLPDGSSVARTGFIMLGGRAVLVTAGGSLAGVGSIYLDDTVPPTAAAQVAAALRRSGISLSRVRCARDPARADRLRGWYHLVVRGVQGNLYVGPLASGHQGYTLYLDRLPPMLQEEAAHFVDCPGGELTPEALAGIQTGQAGIVAVIEALLRPTGAAASLPWHVALPAIQWRAGAPQRIARPDYSAGGPDGNPDVLTGDFRTPTTEMTVTATGDAAGADRFYLEGGANLPRDAVFNALQRDGYTLAAVTCGKPYIKMSENWFRISAPGRQPAILYRSMSISTGRPTENYAIRLDNVAPPLQPGQRSANGGACPG
jgi:hypothetical protein